MGEGEGSETASKPLYCSEWLRTEPFPHPATPTPSPLSPRETAVQMVDVEEICQPLKRSMVRKYGHSSASQDGSSINRDLGAHPKFSFYHCGTAFWQSVSPTPWQSTPP